MEVWADDAAGLMDTLGIERAHIHGTSMGGMVAIVFAAKYAARTASVVINSAAAKLGTASKLLFQNWIDVVQLAPDGPGSRTLADMIAWQGFTRTSLERDDLAEFIEAARKKRAETNSTHVYVAACCAIRDLDVTEWLPHITAPALVLGGEQDIMSPWDQGPRGVGQEGIFRAVSGAEKYVIPGCGHFTILDATDQHVSAVRDFFRRHSMESGPS